MNDKITAVSINNPMFEQTYKFPYDKETFMGRFNNQIIGCGYFTDTAMTGETIIVNPVNCSLIEIREIDFKA